MSSDVLPRGIGSPAPAPIARPARRCAAAAIPTRRRRRGRRGGARAAPSLGAVPPAQVLDDPHGVADHLAAEHQHRHVPLAGQRVDLVRRSRLRQATRCSSTSTPCRVSSRATRPHGHSQFVRRAAAVQRRAHGDSHPRDAGRARPAAPRQRSASGWRAPGDAVAEALASTSRTVSSTVSSCGRTSSRARDGRGRCDTSTTRGGPDLGRRHRRAPGQRARRTRPAPARPA